VSDEIIVVDSFSTDKTEEICKHLGVKFFQNKFDGYKEQKNYALQFASNDYVLSLDADEALSEELKESILKEKDTLTFDGYYFNRLNNYCGQWIYHSNWYPDKKLRLFNKNKGAWGGINPHDRFILNKGCASSRLEGDILHWVLGSYEAHMAKANNFSTIAANEYFKLGRSSSIMKILVNSGWRFFKAYILRLGFLDGFNGFVISSFSAYTSFLKYVKLRQLILESRGNKRSYSPRKKNVKIAS
jgi:glycosyltransferase involved in cell wall biosynthesis